MLKVGLTGGIGSGKSTVTQFFAKLGAPIIDADVIGRDIILKKNCPENNAFTAITQHFGTRILAANGEIERKQLRKIIFDNPRERKWLENLLHPLIYAKIEQSWQSLQAPYCIVVIPLLFETHSEHLVDRILVIDITTANQIQHLIQRDKLHRNDAEHALQAQMTNEMRLKMADDVIDNNSSLIELKKQVLKLHRFYTQCKHVLRERIR